jgi:hypothetical protein
MQKKQWLSRGMLVVVMAVVVSMGTSAWALPDWAFSDGFEGVGAASLPSGSDLDPDLTIWNWADIQETNAGDQTAIQVGNGPFAAAGGNNFVRVADSGTTSTHFFLERSWGANNPAPQAAISNLSEDFTWEFSMRVDSANSHGRVFLGKRTNSGNPHSVQQALGIAIEGSRLKTYLADVPQDIQAVSINTWYDVRVEADWASSTFDLFLDGNPLGNHPFNYNFSGDFVNSMHAISWLGGDLYLDEVSLAPEPATMALLALGIPAVMRRRRK